MTEAFRFPPAVERWLAEAAADPEAFRGRAADALPWFRRWHRVFEPDPPNFRWFVGEARKPGVTSAHLDTARLSGALAYGRPTPPCGYVVPAPL